MAYTRINTTDGVTVMNKDLYDNLQDGIDNTKEVFNMFRHGADITGVNPCDSVFNQALNSGLPIYFPKGIYSFKSKIDTTNSVIMYGDSKDNTIINFLPSSTEQDFFGIFTVGNFYCKDLCINLQVSKDCKFVNNSDSSGVFVITHGTTHIINSTIKTEETEGYPVRLVTMWSFSDDGGEFIFKSSEIYDYLTYPIGGGPLFISTSSSSLKGYDKVLVSDSLIYTEVQGEMLACWSVGTKKLKFGTIEYSNVTFITPNNRSMVASIYDLSCHSVLVKNCKTIIEGSGGTFISVRNVDSDLEVFIEDCYYISKGKSKISNFNIALTSNTKKVVIKGGHYHIEGCLNATISSKEAEVSDCYFYIGDCDTIYTYSSIYRCVVEAGSFSNSICYSSLYGCRIPVMVFAVESGTTDPSRVTEIFDSDFITDAFCQKSGEQLIIRNSKGGLNFRYGKSTYLYLFNNLFSVLKLQGVDITEETLPNIATKVVSIGNFNLEGNSYPST